MPMYVPDAWAIPVFTAAPYPAFCLWMTLKRVSVAAKASIIFGEPSVEPSSMQIASKSASVWFAMDSRHCSRYFSVLYMGMIIEIGGVIVVARLLSIWFVLAGLVFID